MKGDDYRRDRIEKYGRLCLFTFQREKIRVHTREEKVETEDRSQRVRTYKKA